MMRCIMLICLISSISLRAYAQYPQELEVLGKLKEVKEEKESEKIQDKYEHVNQNTNELQLLFSGLFIGYKKFISSQDAQNCSFTPSCSEYALQAVKQQGIIKGLLNGFDRLTRCNSLSPEKYELDPKTQLLKDPLVL